jgi:hypothetical protein
VFDLVDLELSRRAETRKITAFMFYPHSLTCWLALATAVGMAPVPPSCGCSSAPPALQQGKSAMPKGGATCCCRHRGNGAAKVPGCCGKHCGNARARCCDSAKTTCCSGSESASCPCRAVCHCGPRPATNDTAATPSARRSVEPGLVLASLPEPHRVVAKPAIWPRTFERGHFPSPAVTVLYCRFLI